MDVAYIIEDFHPHPNLHPSRGKGFVPSLIIPLKGRGLYFACPHPSPLPEGEGE